MCTARERVSRTPLCWNYIRQETTHLHTLQMSPKTISGDYYGETMGWRGRRGTHGSQCAN